LINPNITPYAARSNHTPLQKVTSRFLPPPRGRNYQHSSDLRILQDRYTTLLHNQDRVTNQQKLFSSTRLLVQVFNGGLMPSAVPRVYFAHPVLVTGSESEGAIPIYKVDNNATVSVIVLNQVPSVGDYLIAYAVGGQWVSDETSSRGGESKSCSPCPIPTADLTVSWTNVLHGNGSATLVYSGGLTWDTIGCDDNNLQFHLACSAGAIELQVFFFVSGPCPTGVTQYCSNLRIAPLSLSMTNYTCSPFSLTFTVSEADCEQLFSNGDMKFTVTL
jgi:hypothetical protein